MSEGTHSHTDAPTWSSRFRSLGSNRPALIVSALAVALLAAGVLIQVSRSETGVAADGGAGRSRSSAGTAKVGGESQQMARVGNQIITRQMLADECIERHGQDVLENIINRTIIQQACMKRGIQLTRAEVQQEVQRIAQKFKLQPDTWYQMLQAERNLSPIQYQRDVIWPMLALRKIAGEEIVVTQADIIEAFERDYGPRVEAKMIMLDNQRRAQDVWRMAKEKPDDFSRLAREFSIEPTSRALGGDIPAIRKHVGSKTLVGEAFRLKPNEISGIIELSEGRYVILLCEGITEPVVTDINEVRDIIVANVREEKQQEAVANVFEQLKREIRVDNFVTNTTTGGVQQTSGTNTKSATVGGQVVPVGRSPQRNPSAPGTANPFRR